MKKLKPADFKHLERMAPDAVAFFDSVLDQAGLAYRLTSDWRDPAANATASGSSPTSLHLSGRAIDLVLEPWNRETLWKFAAAVVTVAAKQSFGVELELVSGPTDKHLHLGLFPDSRPSRLVLSLT